MYQTDVIYHTCGALPLLAEFPCGYKPRPYTFNEILDIGLCMLEEIVAFARDHNLMIAITQLARQNVAVHFIVFNNQNLRHVSVPLEEAAIHIRDHAR